MNMIAPAPRYQEYKRHFTEHDLPLSVESEDENIGKRFSSFQGKIINVTLAHPVGAILAAVAFGAVLGFLTKRLKR